MSAMRRGWLAVACAFALMFAARESRAACNALVVCTCTMTNTGVSFGDYAATNAVDNDAAGSVTVTCLLTAARAGSFSLALSAGNSSSFISRSMKSGGSVLSYNLYTTDARTQVLGDGTGGSRTATGAISALLTSITTLNVYGRISAKQNVPTGSYSDTIIVTITY